MSKQTVVSWYIPSDSLPEEGQQVVVSMSGHSKDTTWKHCLAIAYYDDEIGWVLDNLDPDLIFNKMTVHAWCDIEPFGGESWRKSE